MVITSALSLSAIWDALLKFLAAMTMRRAPRSEKIGAPAAVNVAATDKEDAYLGKIKENAGGDIDRQCRIRNGMPTDVGFVANILGG